ncbi:methyl-accepting chemotaxis protein [Phormidium sp. LEGE 05292]|uniref:methyl-accepting chemotaxis protein n=1 Tax=[Phormidium] sp. LEGE 05292 TaxID=767427 RepID=UPI0018812CCB|nr:methyl-accepting chemotaxis protein [Phormidium sp. LEGE 05292]MBE9227540.1 methyl-accepting chemotaxis protein [Phormidium sp. LEGE 05292]
MGTAFFNKFQNKLSLLLAIGLVVPTVIVSVYSINSSSRELTSLVSGQMKLEGENSKKSINQLIDISKADVLYLSQTPPIQGIVRARENNDIDPLDQSTYSEWVKRLNIIFVSFLEARPYYYRIKYLDQNGKELVRVNSRSGSVEIVQGSQLQNQFNTKFFKDAINLRLGEVYVSEVNLNRENGKIETPFVPIIRFATPIYNAQGEKRGLVVASILANNLFQNGKNDYLKNNFEQRFFVVNEDGYYLYHPDESRNWGFELNKDTNLKRDYPAEVVNEILSGQNGLTDKTTNSLINYQSFLPDPQHKDSAFVLVYETPEKAVYSSIDNFKFFAFIISVLSLLIGLLVGIVILRSLVKSIQEIVGTVSSFSTELSSTVVQQERMASQQSSSVQQTTATMDELSVSSRQSAEQAESAALGAQESLRRVDQGNNAVQRVLEEMNNLKQRVEEIAENAVHLGQQTNQIGNVSDVVISLANQTNMLALNAAIEAVRAGENGKGFSVVAAEIRKLADESGKSAQQITALVKEIQTAIHVMVGVAEAGTKNVDLGVQISHDMAKIFADIAQSVEKIVENSQAIALTYKQQAIATQQVTEAMNHLSQGANETAKGISQTKQGTQELKQVVLKLSETI